MQPAGEPIGDDPQVLESEFAVEDVDPEMLAAMAGTPCWGVACVEGVQDGSMPRRTFAVDSLTFAPTPFAIKWQPAEAEGHVGAVVTGRVDAMWRDGALIRFVGMLDTAGMGAGAEMARQVAGGFVRGVSVKVDDMDADDIEEIYAEPLLDDADEDLAVEDAEAYHLPGQHNQKDHGYGKHGKGKASERQRKASARRIKARGDKFLSGDRSVDGAVVADGLMGQMPSEIVVHAARVRSITVLPEQAFVECCIYLGQSPFEPPTVAEHVADPMVAAAVGPHDTPTTDAAWDGPANEKRLPSPMSADVARNFYAWIDDDAIVDGQLDKASGRFGHHEVDEAGTPGAANIKACQTGIGVLNGGRGGTTIPDSDVQGVYDHLAGHLRDAGLEAPPLETAAVEEPAVVTAAAYTITIPEVWPEWWFDEPSAQDMAIVSSAGAVQITAEGRLFGLLAPAGVSHRAFRARGKSVTVPRNVDYSEFMNKPALVAGADGGVWQRPAGSLTFDCGHASPFDQRRADPNFALQHYENTCSIAARVCVGENRYGTWVAGGLLHGITPDAIERMMASALSGDWQDNRLKAALFVPVEGFPQAVRSSVRIRQDSLVASCVPVEFMYPYVEPEPDLDDAFDLIASVAGRDVQTRWAEVLTASGHTWDSVLQEAGR